MSKFTKCLVLFLLVALLIAQMLPAHAASAETRPEINPHLCGVINGQDNLQLYNLSKKTKSYLEYRGNPDMGFDNVVCMLNQNNALTTYYLGADNRVYLEDEQDHRFVEPAYTLEDRIWDFAAAPLSWQIYNGSVIAVPYDGVDELMLISLRSGMVYDRIYVPFTEQAELMAIAAKYVENCNAEYYLLDRAGAIWCIALEITDHPDKMAITSIEKIVETGVLALLSNGFYFDGDLIYRTYQTESGSCLMAIDPETKAVYNYGIVEEGVTIWGLYDACKMAPNCNDVPEPIDTLDATFNGLFWQNGQDDNRLVTIKTKGMKNYKQHLEFRGDPNLVLEDVICQENADGEVETYYFGYDNYIYVEDEQDHRFLNQTIRLDYDYCAYAPGPFNYQSTKGWAVGISDSGVRLTLINLFTGEEEGNISLVGLMDSLPSGMPLPTVGIAAKKLMGSKAEYYLLDMDGKIWSVTISFPEFELTAVEEVAETGAYATYGDGFYFDGTWLFSTYSNNNKGASVVLAYHPETDTLYDLGIVEQGMKLYGLHEAGKIPTVKPHEHDWAFVGFRWEANLEYKAYAVFKCTECGSGTEIQASVSKVSGTLNLYRAVVSANDSLDGSEHSETRQGIIPSLDPNKKKKEMDPFPFKPIELNPKPIGPRLP